MTTKQNIDIRKIIAEEFPDPLMLLKHNYSNYSKPRSCTEKKSICWLCSYYKNGKCSPAEFINDDDKKIIQLKWREIMNENNLITKDKLREIAKNYGLKLTDRLLAHYKDLGLIELSIMKNKLKLGLDTPGTIGLYKADTPKLLYTIQNLKKLGIRLQLEDIKYYIKLLKFDPLAFRELKKIKEEDLHLKMFLTLKGITPEQSEQLQKKYHSYFCEILLSRYDIFEDALRIWLYFDLIEPYILMDHESLEFLEAENIINNPDIDTENLDEVKVRYDDPINKTITFKNL